MKNLKTFTKIFWKSWLVLLAVLALSVPVMADYTVQAEDTNAVKLDGSAGATLQQIDFDPSGHGGTTPSGLNAYFCSAGTQYGWTEHTFDLPVIPDGNYTAQMTYTINNAVGIFN